MADVKGGGAFGLSREDLLLILFLVWLFSPGIGLFSKSDTSASGGLFGSGNWNQLLVILLFLLLSGGCI
ncbi:hypothetical protein [Calorimonas adulescens]|uniref:Uncharacterized protein n=1 Tax=Calorimonas adulescens TaxID=2606906 RepID=A0A5D8QH27_9THEO|nr:hypothetical protein [Calorimonas adulescens]TZE83176.1 hypothetical protein FWJ32_02310 [Calorimonas adulescens]